MTSDRLAPTKLYIRNYKSFGAEEQGFDSIKPTNLIVGRNNSGKSALLDLVQFSCGNFTFPPSTKNPAGEVEVIIETPLPIAAIEKVFSKGTSGGIIAGNHFQFGQQYFNRQIKITVSGDGKQKSFISLDSAGIPTFPGALGDAIARVTDSPLSGNLSSVWGQIETSRQKETEILLESPKTVAGLPTSFSALLANHRFPTISLKENY